MIPTAELKHNYGADCTAGFENGARITLDHLFPCPLCRKERDGNCDPELTQQLNTRINIDDLKGPMY